MFMDSEKSPPSTDLLKCCGCGCSSCGTLINGGSITWQRSVKRKFDELQDGFPNGVPSFDQSSVAKVEIENECTALRETVSSQQQTIQELYTELDEERNASSSAANEAMSMILRVQREKAEIQMEARQFKRFAEEKMAHDQQELLALEDLLYKRDQAIQALNCEVQAYKHRMLSLGLTEAEVEGQKSPHSRNPNLGDNVESQFEFPPYDYPPIRCNMNENQCRPDVEDDVDLEKYAFGETPRPFSDSPFTREHLQNLENRIYQMERNPSSNHLDREFFGTRNISEKGVIGQSPKRPGHARMFSTDSFGSLYGTVKETAQDSRMESPKTAPSFKKMNYFSHTEEYSNLRKLDNASDHGDDMSDRVYTIDSIHNGVSYNKIPENKPAIGICEDYVNTPRDSLNIGDPDVKKLYTRLQALEADRESMKQAMISMRTDKAQLVLLREIAQQLCKEMTPERRISPPVKKPSLIGSFSLISVLKWIVSFVFWRKKARRSKYMFGLSAENVGLLMLLDKGPCVRPWRCLSSIRPRK
ncbi:myosin-binding protein 7-like [Macadamia integrifolia]|uniref:myosin-binding protein 7-like n=1 Tax=Macadamia integrifolia TaxID=60698 RepID=UPI001C4FFA57|nr:myosin-binding protein 7-like [Macadamia integrifolia]XP_042509835.1 myosin-binding protein 7-like [Macadamia integrifolia]